MVNANLKTKMTLKESIIEKMFRKNIINTVCHKNKIYAVIQEMLPFVDTEFLSTSKDESEDDVRMTFGELGSVDMKFVWEFMNIYDFSGKTTIDEPYEFFCNILHTLGRKIDILVTNNYNNGGTNIRINTSKCGRIYFTILPDMTVKGFINECRGLEKLSLCMKDYDDVFSDVTYENNAMHITFVGGKTLDVEFSKKSSVMTKLKNIV